MDLKDKLLLTEKEASELLSMSSHFLRRDRISSNSVGIPYIEIGASIRYRRVDLEVWIERQSNLPKKSHDKPIQKDRGVQTTGCRGRPTKAEQVKRRSSVVRN